ncbi:MAG TPA: hypothetical protein VGG57_10205 [Stellaceae bacterium]|jgi:hypothetical protein
MLSLRARRRNLGVYLAVGAGAQTKTRIAGLADAGLEYLALSLLDDELEQLEL